MRRGTEDNSEIIFSRRDGSYEGHNICFKGVIWKIIHKLSLLEHRENHGD